MSLNLNNTYGCGFAASSARRRQTSESSGSPSPGSCIPIGAGLSGRHPSRSAGSSIGSRWMPAFSRSSTSWRMASQRLPAHLSAGPGRRAQTTIQDGHRAGEHALQPLGQRLGNTDQATVIGCGRDIAKQTGGLTQRLPCFAPSRGGVKTKPSAARQSHSISFALGLAAPAHPGLGSCSAPPGDFCAHGGVVAGGVQLASAPGGEWAARDVGGSAGEPIVVVGGSGSFNTSHAGRGRAAGRRRGAGRRQGDISQALAHRRADHARAGAAAVVGGRQGGQLIGDAVGACGSGCAPAVFSSLELLHGKGQAGLTSASSLGSALARSPARARASTAAPLQLFGPICRQRGQFAPAWTFRVGAGILRPSVTLQRQQSASREAGPASTGRCWAPRPDAHCRGRAGV